MFANCVHANIGILLTSEREIILSPNCSKFAVEYDWNCKTTQNVRILGFLEKKKKMGFFEKNLEIFETGTCGKFFLQCVSNDIFPWKCPSTLSLMFFWQKSEKNSKLEKLEIMMKKQSNLKKKRFHPSKRHF